MGASYKILTERVEGVYKDRRSRFIAYLQPIQGEADAKVALDEIRGAHHAARHVCYAIVIDETVQPVINDDGEPSGSAGRPILHALQRAELSYTLGAVVRYFGGIKLGVPGLIAAYRGAVEEALAGAAIEERPLERQLSLVCPYGALSTLHPYIKETEGRIVAERYEAETCHIEAAWPEVRVEAVVAWTESYGVQTRIEGAREGVRILPPPYVPIMKKTENN